MAEFDKLDDYIDESALRKQTDFILGLFKEVEAGGSKVAESFKGLSFKFEGKDTGTKDLLDGIKKLELTTANYQKILTSVSAEVGSLTEEQKKNLKVVQDQYKAEETARAGVKETVNLLKTEIGQTAKLEASKSELAKTIALNRAEQAALNREQKLAAALNTSERNSLGRAQALILQYTNEKKKLNLATQEGIRLNESYNKAIQKSNDFILKNADSETKRTKNIGEYSKSAQIIVEALEKEKRKLEELEKTRIRVQNAGAQFSPAASTNTQISRTQITGFSGGSNSSGISRLGSDAKIAASEIDNLDKQIEQSKNVIEGFSRVAEQPKFLNIAGKVGDAQAELKFFTKALIDLERQGLGNSESAKNLRKNLAELTDQIADAKSEVKALSSDTRGIDLFAGSISFAADAFQTAAGAAVLFGASEEDAAAATRTLIAVQSVSNGIKGIANELTTRGTAANKVYAFAQLQVKTAMDVTASAAARLRAALITIGIGALIIGIGLLVANFSKIKNYLSNLNDEQKLNNKISEDGIEIRKKALENTNDEIVKVKILYQATQNQNLSLKDRKKAVDALQEQYPKYFKSLSDEAILAGKAADKYDQLTKSILQTGLAEAAKEKIKEISKSMLDAVEIVSKADAAILKVQKDGVVVQDKIIPKRLASGNSVNIAPIRISTDEKEKEKSISAIKGIYSDAYLAVNEGNARIESIIKTVGANNLIDAVLGGEKSGSKKASAKVKEDVDAAYEILVFDKKRRIALSESIANDEESGYLERLTALTDFLRISQELLDLQNAQELRKKGLSKNEQLVIEAKYEDERIKLSEDGSKRLEDIRKGNAKKEIKLSEELRNNIASKLQASIDDEAEKREKAFEKEQDLIKRRKELYKTLYDEILQTIIAFADASFDAENNKLEKQKEGVDKQTEVDLAANEVLVQSESDKAENIIKINERAQAQKEQIGRKQRAIEIQKAQFDKAANIANIITETALAVIRALGAKPFTPANIALAAVTGAIGAAQLARAVAVKIPQFKDGLFEDYEGWAITGDGGKREAHIHKDGTVSITPNVPTPTYIEPGDRIHPDADVFMKSMQQAAMMDVARTAGRKVNESNYGEIMTKNLEQQFDKQTQLLTKIANKKELHLTAKQGGMEAIWKWGSNQTRYTDENTNW